MMHNYSDINPYWALLMRRRLEPAAQYPPPPVPPRITHTQDPTASLLGFQLLHTLEDKFLLQAFPEEIKTKLIRLARQVLR